MSPPFTLRDARPDDESTIVAFNRALAHETEHKDLAIDVVTRGVRRVLVDPARGRYFVAVVDDAVVGQLMITREWSDWRDGWFFWIQSVYVAPAHRRRGLYRALHAHVVDVARAQGDVCGVRLYVEPDNERARRTYLALGMSHTYDVMEQPL
jgi:GNAT superfamily N-acetyltransferase